MLASGATSAPARCSSVRSVAVKTFSPSPASSAAAYTPRAASVAGTEAPAARADSIATARSFYAIASLNTASSKLRARKNPAFPATRPAELARTISISRVESKPALAANTNASWISTLALRKI